MDRRRVIECLKFVCFAAVFLIAIHFILIRLIIPHFQEDPNYDKRMELIANFKYAQGVDDCEFIIDRLIGLMERRENGLQIRGYGWRFEDEVRQGLMKSCVMAASAYQENLTMCFDLYDEAECLDSYLMSIRSKDKLLRVCNTSEDSFQSVCSPYLSIARDDPQHCLNEGGGYFTGTCFHYMAFRTHNQSICIDGWDWQNNNCKEVLTFMGAHTIDSCQPYVYHYTSNTIEECYTIFSMYNRNPDLCDKYLEEKYIALNGELDYWYKRCLKYSSYN